MHRSKRPHDLDLDVESWNQGRNGNTFYLELINCEATPELTDYSVGIFQSFDFPVFQIIFRSSEFGATVGWYFPSFPHFPI
jgi:hypothetical protein